MKIEVNATLETLRSAQINPGSYVRLTSPEARFRVGDREIAIPIEKYDATMIGIARWKITIEPERAELVERLRQIEAEAERIRETLRQREER